MIASNPSVVIDLNSLLPPEGENEVSFECDKSRLRITVKYDNDSNITVDKNIKIVFDGVVQMHYSTVPGVELFNVQYKANAVGKVIEYKYSEAASAWSAHFGWAVRHYHVYFLNTNKRIDVFSTECSIES